MAGGMIPFDTFTLAAVAAELRKMVPGAWVQKAQQPSATELVLSVYGKAGAHRLLLSADPQAFRVHLTQVKRDNPVTPPHFCQVCRSSAERMPGRRFAQPRTQRQNRAVTILDEETLRAFAVE